MQNNCISVNIVWTHW